MKNPLFIIILTLLLGSCSVTNNYYQAYIQSDATVYARNRGTRPIGKFYRGTLVHIDTTSYKSGYKRIVFNGRPAWIYSPADNVKYTFNRPSVTSSAHSTSSTTSSSGNGRSNSYTPTSSGGTVHVKGYYRKNGTYVRPHTRSSPGRR